jgi:hypothetical protein
LADGNAYEGKPDACHVLILLPRQNPVKCGLERFSLESHQKGRFLWRKRPFLMAMELPISADRASFAPRAQRMPDSGR